jgi:hypothetical protein
MKKTLLLAGLLLVVAASVASAAGLSINWGTVCWGDNPKANLTWSCSSNTFTGVKMTASFMVDETKSTFVSTDLYMEGMTEAATVPDWWQLGTGGCRAGQAGLLNAPQGATCPELWSGSESGSGFGGIGLYYTDTNRMHINAVWAIGEPVEAPAQTEIFAAMFTIGASKSVGATKCLGCAVPAIWALNYIQVGYFGETQATVLDRPFPDGNQCLTYFGSTLPCAKPVPARNTTWGQVKSLYR